MKFLLLSASSKKISASRAIGISASSSASKLPASSSTNPALFVVFLLLLFSNFFVMVFDCFLFGGGWGNIDQLKLEVEYQTNHTPYIHYLTMLPSAQNFGSISTSHRFQLHFLRSLTLIKCQFLTDALDL